MIFNEKRIRTRNILLATPKEAGKLIDGMPYFNAKREKHLKELRMSHTTTTINKLNVMIDTILQDRSLSTDIKYMRCNDLINLRDELLAELDQMSDDLQEAANGNN